MPTLPSLRAWLRANWRRLLLLLSLFTVALLLLPLTHPPEPTARAITTQVLLRSTLSEAQAPFAAWRAAHPGSPLALTYQGPEETRREALEKLKESKDFAQVELRPPAPGEPWLALQSAPDPAASSHQRLTLTLHQPSSPDTPLLSSSRRVGSWTALLPPLLAVLLALTFKRLLVALLSAVWLGAALQVGFHPWLATQKTVVTYLVHNASDSFNLYVIGFTISLVGMVHVMLKMGGMAGLLDRIGALATSTRATRLTTALMGSAIFFDDYANTIVVGSTMRPVSDNRRISREKLAFLVDATSAPIAGLAIISTWIGYEVGLFDDLSRQLALGASGYEIFFAMLPSRFYCLLTLAFVLYNAWSGRDFGPMLAAERRASERGELLRPGAELLNRVDLAHLTPAPHIPTRWQNAVFPVLFVLCCVFLGMYWSGWRGANEAQIPSFFELLAGSPSHLSAALSQLGSFTTWRDAFSNADNAKVLFWSATLGSALCIVLALTQRLLTAKEAAIAWLRAIPGMWMAIAILLLAWSIRAVCDDLGTSIYLVGAVRDLLSPLLLPLITFLLAALVAFSTGTSWGTMGILLPAIIPLAFYMTHDASSPPAESMNNPLLLLCFSAVLDGAIFGDHCSPISDTTVMSSIASECDHIDHVRTQAPYALTTMSVAAVVGYVGVPLGLPWWGALLLGVLIIVAILRLFGKTHAPPLT